MGARINIENLQASYGSVQVLHGINLDIAAGEFVALLGSSGCGKTTLLRSVSGLFMPSGGKIFLDGTDITTRPPEKRNMAMVFQSYALWPHMTVRQNIGYGLKLRGKSAKDVNQKVDELAAMLGLTEFVDRKTPQLSGGQRQRVALGRALAIDPPVLLLDEPLSNLDARIRLSMRHEIRMLQQRLGITAIHVTHDREEAMVMADRIVILDKGHVAQVGAPEEVYERPANSFVAAFMGAENQFRTRGGANGEAVTLQSDAEECRLPKSKELGDGGVHWNASGNADVSIRFRSEEATLVPQNEQTDGFYRINGTIRQASYPGGVRRYAVQTGEDMLIVDELKTFSEGDQVSICLKPNAIHVFEEE
nr:ABC transporter ATP-binding protein [Ruegeria lacuscaerulensis]